ncbi:MAG: hypothetical protein D6674_00800 [Acidobacteria bacterium]|nr:MAG: hypothetical protein D6674_00800 [Acidobacteriota bacterium]
MRSSEKAGKENIHFKTETLAKKLLLLVFTFLLSFSSESERTDIKLAQSYFYRGYIAYSQGNYTDAIANLGKSHSLDKSGYYGELSYLYIGLSYAHLSYKLGEREGIFSAIAYLNMYPYHYKRANYLLLQKEFIGDCYLMLGMYGKAKDVFWSLYREEEHNAYLLKFLYADALNSGANLSILDRIDPSKLPERDYMYPLVRGFMMFNLGDYKSALTNLSEARSLNRYLEDDPEFLYRYAISHFMEGDWRNAVFYLELLDRKDVYKKYYDSLNYYLALIYLQNRNYADAVKRIRALSSIGGLKYRLLLSQLWAFPDFLEKQGKDFGDYKKLLIQIAWTDLNKVYSEPAVLGLYFYSIKDKKIMDKDVISLKALTLPQEITLGDLRVNVNPPLEMLKGSFKSLDPYSEDASFLVELFKANEENYSLLFGYEKLARAVVYQGRTELIKVVERLDEPLKSFLLGQVLLLDGSVDMGLRLLEGSLSGLSGEDREEALLLIGIYKRDVSLLEDLLSKIDFESSKRLYHYFTPSVLLLGDYYYSSKQYERAKTYYRSYLEKAEEDNLYWLVAYKLAKSSELTGDTKTLGWVVRMAEGKDNIISKVIIALWG